jgi:succinate dehydrogenase / fumarate reductase flavoprotein subunit
MKRLGIDYINEQYGNLFEMYERITGEDPYKVPMRIYPALHYTMGGLWVDYNLMSNIPGLFVLGEANFSDHGANRLGASALMQGLADGYFVIPYTMGDYLASSKFSKATTDAPEFKEAEKKVEEEVKRIASLKGKKTILELHRELGLTMWDYVGMARTEQRVKTAMEKIPAIQKEFWSNALVPGNATQWNKYLEYAIRLSDCFGLAELLALDAIERNESCGCHFREESQTEDGEARRNDEKYSYVAAWEYAGEDKTPVLHKEMLEFKDAKPSQRSYK